MTLFQETASVPKSLNANSADKARFQAILTGLVVVLMAVAVASFVVAGRPTGATIEGNLAVEAKYANGYPLHGGLAGPSRIAIDSAGGFAPGYPLQGGLAGPSHIDEADASVYRFLLPDDQAAGNGSSLRFAPQPAEGATNGDNQRSIHAD